MFIHTVYFWLQPTAAPHAAEQLAQDCRELLGRIPGVRQVFAGVPAVTPRPVVDNSYAVGLTVVLDDATAHDIYQNHELHLLFIERNKGNWGRVQVYDFK